jgi:hypothetical protein
MFRRTLGSAVALSFVLSALGTAASAPVLPVVSKTKGTLSVRPSTDQEHEVSTAQRTREGDTLKTLSGSLADIALADHARVRLGPQTTTRVLSTDGGLTLQLAQGGLCVVATSGQVGISAGGTLATALAPVIYSVQHDSAGLTLLAVYRGEVRTGGIRARAGQAYSFDKTGNETEVPISSVADQLASLECPDPSVIAETLPIEATPPVASPGPTGGGGGGGGALGIIAGLGLIAAAAGGGGKGGGGSTGVNASGSAVVGFTPSPLNITNPSAAGTATIAGGDSGSFTHTGGTCANASVNNKAVTVGRGAAAAGASCTVIVRDSAGNTGTLTVNVGKFSVLTVTPTSVTFARAGDPGVPVTATESGFNGIVSLSTSDCSGIATMPGSISISSGTALFTAKAVSPVHPGTCSYALDDGHNVPITITLTVPGPLSASPAAFNASATPTSITLTDPHYNGVITASNTCGEAVTVSGSGTSWSAVGTGASPDCTIAFTDSLGNSVAVKATVIAPGSARRRSYSPIGLRAGTPSPASTQSGRLAASEANLAMRIGASVNRSHTISIVEAGYTGAFTLANSRPDVATATLASSGPGSALVTIAAQMGGTAVLTISDANGNHVTIPITVSTAGRGTGPVLRRPPGDPGNSPGVPAPGRATQN